jgi:hypothetical protein
MSVERRHRDLSLDPLPRSRGWWSGAWYLRWQLRSLRHRIAVLEQQLADEFALQDTAPMHEELAALRARQELLQRRLSDRT